MLPTLVNPARAGMIPTLKSFTAKITGKPRASGDDPVKGLSDGAMRL